MINYTIYNHTYNHTYNSYNKTNKDNEYDIIYMFILFIGYGLLCLVIIKIATTIDEYIINNEMI